MLVIFCRQCNLRHDNSLLKQLFKIQIIVCLFGMGVLYPSNVKAQNADTLQQVIDHISDYFLNRNQDSTYIGNYSNELAVKLLTTGKFNYFRVKDRINNSKMRYVPVRDLRLGVGVAYKFFAFDLTFGLGLSDNSELENTRSFDFRARLFTSKQFIMATLQFYQGYRLSSFGTNTIDKIETDALRNDIRTINFGLQYLYALNYTKFSLKAPFVFNELQKKSAGSFLFGANYSMFTLDSDSSIVPVELNQYFRSTLYLTDLNTISVGLSFGYMYTYVFKENFFITLSVIPGLNYNAGDYYNDARHDLPTQINVKLNTMNAIGYNGRRFFAGLNFLSDGYWIKIADKLNVEVGHGSASVFVGYRFKGRK